ncbi:hypothetical protein PPRY_a6002 [Pseudoalteromonas prydzensis ACAM 620]|nr:hypothetical protein [Pseudoalteromonas prydzensis ACAM 620]
MAYSIVDTERLGLAMNHTDYGYVACANYNNSSNNC